MPRLNLFAPENEAKSSGGSFKEGNVRVGDPQFAVVSQGNAENQRAPVVAIQFKVTRLDEEQHPLTDEDGNPSVEILNFSLGGSSLSKIHPGQADNPEDEEVIDNGAEVGTVGNTLYLVDESFRINEKSSAAWLLRSLRKAGWKDEYNRMWAPDYDGAVFFMGTEVDDSNKMERRRKDANGKEQVTQEGIPYKVVKKILKTPYGGGKKAGAGAASTTGGKTDKSASASAAKPEETKALELFKKIAEAKAGETLTFKLLSATANNLIGKNFEPKSLVIPIISKFKDHAWVNKTATKLEYEFELNGEDQVTTISFPGGSEDDTSDDTATD